ncbi:MAG: hypothetical protein ABI488_00595 [Polyangiaceae bacterium]
MHSTCCKSTGCLDLLVFTGGIGEHSAPIRAAVCQRLGALGLELDLERNRSGETEIERRGSACAIHVIATDEERMVARHAHAVARAPA